MPDGLAAERQAKLLSWLRKAIPAFTVGVGPWPTTKQIVLRSPVYAGMAGDRYSRAMRDLAALERGGKVRRVPFSRPARWEVCGDV